MIHRYRFTYETACTFVPSVRDHFFKLRTVPMACAFQHIISRTTDIRPESLSNEASDAFGNTIQYGSCRLPHDTFTVQSSGTVECARYEEPDDAPADYYRFPSHMTEWRYNGEGLPHPIAAADMAAADEIEQGAAMRHLAIGIMAWTHSHLHYERFATDNTTTADEALRLGKGVCQDFAHVMIAACRHLGLHARYACGLVLGEGETHAWVEVHDGKCWHGYDPTHNRCIDYGYLKFAHGRDVGDCPMNRGRFYGWTSEQMSVNCKLTEL